MSNDNSNNNTCLGKGLGELLVIIGFQHGDPGFEISARLADFLQIYNFYIIFNSYIQYVTSAYVTINWHLLESPNNFLAYNLNFGGEIVEAICGETYKQKIDSVKLVGFVKKLIIGSHCRT